MSEPRVTICPPGFAYGYTPYDETESFIISMGRLGFHGADTGDLRKSEEFATRRAEAKQRSMELMKNFKRRKKFQF